MYRSGVSKKISRGWEENVSPPLSFIANARVLYGKSDLLKKNSEANRGPPHPYLNPPLGEREERDQIRLKRME